MNFLPPIPTIPKDLTADEIIQVLEGAGYGWSLDHTGHMVEARIWNWPWVVGRYRPGQVEPLADMLRAAISNIGKEPRDVG